MSRQHTQGTRQRLIRSNQLKFDRDLKMTERMFRLLELLQKLDAVIDRTRRTRGADPIALARLKTRKMKLRDRLARQFAALSSHMAPMPA